LKLVYADPTPRWAPFATVAILVAVVWGGSLWQGIDIQFATQFSAGLGMVLLVLVLLQGRLFWRYQVASVSSDGATFEAVTSVWVGEGRRVRFAPHETAGWVARAKSGGKELSSIAFKAKGQPLELSFLNPRQVDVPALSGMQPIFFAQLKRDYPELRSLAA